MERNWNQNEKHREYNKNKYKREKTEEDFENN